MSSDLSSVLSELLLTGLDLFHEVQYYVISVLVLTRTLPVEGAKFTLSQTD